MNWQALNLAAEDTTSLPGRPTSVAFSTPACVTGSAGRPSRSRRSSRGSSRSSTSAPGTPSRSSTSRWGRTRPGGSSSTSGSRSTRSASTSSTTNRPANPPAPTSPRSSRRSVTLVVIDAAAGAYDASGLDDNKRQDVERFARAWVRPLFEIGITTLLIDHVTKNTETRGKYMIGSERKLGGVDVHLGLERGRQAAHPRRLGRRQGPRPQRPRRIPDPPGRDRTAPPVRPGDPSPDVGVEGPRVRASRRAASGGRRSTWSASRGT